MTEYGYIKIYRELLNKPIWQNSTSEQRSILVAILMLANWKENKWEWKGAQYECQRGEFISSYENISNVAGKGVSRQNVRTALKRFEKLEFLTYQSTHGHRDGIKVIVLNYRYYQDEANRLPNTLLTLSQPTPNTFLTPIEESNNSKKERSKIYINQFEEFWTLYPKKELKKKSQEKFTKHRENGIEFEAIMQGLRNYLGHIVKEKKEMQFIKQPTTWLNNECWNDEYTIIDNEDLEMQEWAKEARERERREREMLYGKN